MNVLEDLEKSILSVKQLNDEGCPTASIAILEDGHISSHVITSGKENSETVYQACSISKPITALAVARLVDLGRISFEGKAIDHLPRSIIEHFVEVGSEHMIKQVTLAMLLSHTAGLSQHGFPGYEDDLPTIKQVFAGEYPSTVPKISFNAFPGSQTYYSGAGFILVQMILENIMCKPFPNLMQDLVFLPLGMTRSWYTDIPEGETNFTNAYWAGYTGVKIGYHRFVEFAAGGLWSTPTDLLRAVSAVQESLHSESGFLKTMTVQAMLTKTGMNEELGAFGLGWAINERFFGHAGGNFPGYMSYLFGSSEVQSKGTTGSNGIATKRGVAVMVNSHFFHMDSIRRIVSAIFYLKGWEKYGSLPLFGKDTFAPYGAPKGTEIDDLWKKWIGRWEDGWEVVDKDGPALSFATQTPVALGLAAAPYKQSGIRNEIVLKPAKLRMGVRFTWKDGHEVVELLRDETKVLQRITHTTL